MASVEKRGERYRFIFMYTRKRFIRTSRTDNERTALAVKGGVKHTILQLQQRVLRVPEGADMKEFIVNGGQVVVPITPLAQTLSIHSAKLQENTCTRTKPLSGLERACP